MCKIILYFFLLVSLLISGLNCDSSTDSSSISGEQENVSLPKNVIITIPHGI